MQNVPPRLEPALQIAGMLGEGAEAALRALRRAGRAAVRKPRGATLRPGKDTPHWNELAATIRAHATQYGDKAKLARILGVPRQRVDDYLVGNRRLPDAERTLQLLHWLAERRAGRPPS